MRAFDRRLTLLEQRGTPSEPAVIVVRHTLVEDASVKWARVVSMNGEATPAAVAARAELEAEGYTVTLGYRGGA
jgi:hypothetical protein